MKKRLLPLLLLTLLVGCTQTQTGSESSVPSNTPSTSTESSVVESSSPSSEAPISSEETTSEASSDNESSSPSSEDVTSEIPSSSEEQSSEPPTSTEPDKTYSDLTEIKALGAALFSKANDKGVYTSTYYAEFTAQLLSVQVYDTNQTGYTASNKVLVANATGHLIVSINGDAYDIIKQYHQDQQVYDFRGYIGVYNNEVEVVMDTFGRPTYRAGLTLAYDYKVFAIRGTNILNFVTKVKALKHNTKGVTWSQDITVYKLKYIAKTDDSQALFTDGVNVISVHSHNYINNRFTKGSVYDVYGREGLFNFKPSFEYIGHTSISDAIEFTYPDVATKITAAELSAFKFEVDKPSALTANFRYTDSLIKFYYFEGYANYYTKGSDDFIVFDDTAKDNYYAITNASSAKALFAKNDSCTNLYDNDWNFCPFNEFAYSKAADKVKVSFYFAPHQFIRDNAHYKIYVFEDTVQAAR